MIDEKTLIEKLKKNSIFEKITNVEGKNIYEIIKELSKVNKWIPIEKELPKNNQEVIVTFVNHKPPLYYQKMKDVPISAFAVYYNSKWYWWTSTICDLLAEYGNCYSEIIDEDIEIIAWMPLPKPYGGK